VAIPHPPIALELPDGDSYRRIGLFNQVVGLKETVRLDIGNAHRLLLRFFDGGVTDPAALPVASPLFTPDVGDDDGIELALTLLCPNGEPMVRYWFEGHAIMPASKDGPLALVGNASRVSPETFEILRLWSRRWPTRMGQWRRMKPPARAAWLDAVRARLLSIGSGQDQAPDQTFHLPGGHIDDDHDFYLAIGEAVHGPLGYLGGDPQAMKECLNGEFGAIAPFTLIWEDSQHSAEALGRAYFEQINDVLTACNVTVQHQTKAS